MRPDDVGVEPVDGAAVDRAVERAVAWLWSMQAPGAPAGVLRMSAAHDPAAWPGCLLKGTYDGLQALALCGALDGSHGAVDRGEVLAFLDRFRTDDGIFRNPDMRPDQLFKKSDPVETRAYVDWHITNYALGAAEALGRPLDRVPAFARPFLDPDRLNAWLGRRDLRDPWLEGNNIVNLASFLLPERGGAANATLSHLLAWHDHNQEPDTGFWGVGQAEPARRLHAMAGATHNFHLFYALDVPISYLERSLDYCLTLPVAASTACLDVDPVDVLAHGAAWTHHRPDDIRTWLAGKLAAVLALQNADGGFPDETDPAVTRCLDGWVTGYAEPQGLSNTFATWFRLIAIAMVDSVLWPGRRDWLFRRMVGIGFARLEGVA